MIRLLMLGLGRKLIGLRMGVPVIKLRRVGQ